MGKKALVLALLIVFVVACYLWYSRPAGGDVPRACDARTDGLSILTYNAGLAPGIVEFSTPRRQAVAEGLASLDFDVLCVQEAWEAESRQAIIDGLRAADVRPLSVLTVDTAGQGETGEDRCSAAEMATVEPCMREHCDGVPAEDMSFCGVEHCKARGIMLYFTARPCLNCLIATAGHGMDEVAHICRDDKGASRIYHGQNGNMLISRHPVLDSETMVLRASGANRVALFATVDVRGREIEVACTHLSSKTFTSPTHPDFTRWEDEQTAQLDGIAERLAARAGDRPRFLVGDLNIGRRNGSFLGDHMREVWDHAVVLGFWSPADEATEPFCTSCSDNMLRHKDTDYLIDHVMLYTGGASPPLDVRCVERLLDDTVTVTGYDGRPVRTKRSDHYALRVTFSP